MVDPPERHEFLEMPSMKRPLPKMTCLSCPRKLSDRDLAVYCFRDREKGAFQGRATSGRPSAPVGMPTRVSHAEHRAS